MIIHSLHKKKGNGFVQSNKANRCLQGLRTRAMQTMQLLTWWSAVINKMPILSQTNILGRGLRIKLWGIVRVLYGSLVAMSDDSVANSKKEKDSLLL